MHDDRSADDYEKRIREKIWESGILTRGEWVYLVGVFGMAREYDEFQKDASNAR